MTSYGPAASLSREELVREAEARLDHRELAGVVDLLRCAQAKGADPNQCAAMRWMAHMLRGDFESAWRENDELRQRNAPDPHRFWLREDIAGKRVMLRSLHGFGDAVQMFRYVPRLLETVSKLIVEVPPRMVCISPYFDSMAKAELITWGENAPAVAPAWDVQCEVMELPYIFRTVCSELPIRQNYLSLPQAEVERVRAAMGPSRGRRVGLVWSAGEWNPARCVPIELLRSVVEVDGCEFWSLQGGQTAGHWNSFADSFPATCRDRLRDAAECGQGILTLATVISELDLVISVDTLAPHLAGALGVPAWVMLQQSADWRWMADREDSPWYPSLRLFRQPRQGDWGAVVEAVRGSLRTLSGRR